ncbi:uncharacterized protein LOC110698228 [Chenopodium quinoa]|uniref:uncharacterized protein LOC110698228 n=1 Tax=Chenopodium quinoa TaxID=63459 RepID=UPI000B7798DE|nr:uncharacterized protein LOC110698228 [Chenopodium quinoa]
MHGSHIDSFLEKCDTIRNELATFRQSDDESLYEAWRKFKRLQRQCPHHGIPEWMLIQTFYNGLTHEFRIYIDAASGGSLMTKNPTEAKELIEKMAANDNYHPGGRHSVKKGGKLDVDALTLLTSSVQALTSKFDRLQAGTSTSSLETYEMCNVQGHIAPNCPKNSSEMSIEEANAFYTSNPKRSYDPHLNTYNEGWRNHLDFSYMNTQAQLNFLLPPPSFQARASFNHQPMNQQLPPQTSKYNLDSIVETFTTSQLRQQELMKKQFKLQAKQNEHFESSIQMLIAQNKWIETHLSQLSQQVSYLSTLHDQPKVQKEQCNAVFLRRDELFSRKIDEKVCSVESRKDEKCEDVKSPKYVAPPAYEEPMRFSQRLAKAVLDKHFGKYCETLKKEIKDQHDDKEVVNEKCSTLLRDSLPPKLHDPGLQKLKPSHISLQMADRTARLPKGVVEDVLVKVGELVFPVDFVVMDMKEDHKIPIIFGRPFLATSQALIDVLKRQVTIRAQDKQVVFKLFNEHNFIFDGRTCLRIDATNPLVDKCVCDRNLVRNEDNIPPNDVFSYMKVSSDTKHVKYKMKESFGGGYFYGQHRGVSSLCGDPG